MPCIPLSHHAYHTLVCFSTELANGSTEHQPIVGWLRVSQNSNWAHCLPQNHPSCEYPEQYCTFSCKTVKTLGIKRGFNSFINPGVKTSILNCQQEVSDSDHYNISKPLMLKTCVMIGSTLQRHTKYSLSKYVNEVSRRSLNNYKSKEYFNRLNEQPPNPVKSNCLYATKHIQPM